jgi:regulator of protease activity HflC (stomatin/prohibitin superfamily)
MSGSAITKIILTLVLLIIGIWLFTSTIVVVDAGFTGVKKTLGKVENDGLAPGLYIVFPLTTSIIQMDNRVQRYENKTAVYSKDVQQAEIAYVVNYSLEKDATVRMYAEVGVYWADKLIPQVIQASMKNVIGQWNAMELIANRVKASDSIKMMIEETLKEHGIRINEFSLTNIDFQDAFEQAVEAKVVAVQEAERAKNKTVTVQEEANQRVIAAKADAEAMQIKTEALTKNQSLIMYEAVLKWDGQLPRIMGGGAGGNFLNIPEGMLK